MITDISMNTDVWYVYLLECSDGSLYCGVTPFLDSRIAKHNAGKGAKYTRSRLPVKLVYNERCQSKSEALKREIQIKKMKRSEKLKLVRKSCRPTNLVGLQSQMYQ